VRQLECRLGPGFVKATLADVAYPFGNIMITVVELRLKYLQVTHSESRAGIWDLDIEPTNNNKENITQLCENIEETN